MSTKSMKKLCSGLALTLSVLLGQSGLAQTSETVSDMSLDQQRVAASRMLQIMVTEVGTVEEAQTSASESNDTVKLTCLTEQLTSMNGFLRIAEDNTEQLNNSDGSDPSRDSQGYQMVLTASQRISALAQTARRCGGGTVGEGGETSRSSDSGDLPSLNTLNDPAAGATSAVTGAVGSTEDTSGEDVESSGAGADRVVVPSASPTS